MQADHPEIPPLRVGSVSERGVDAADDQHDQRDGTDPRQPADGRPRARVHASGWNRTPSAAETTCPAVGGGKCVPITSTGWSQHSAMRRRRVADDSLESVSTGSPTRFGELHGVMHAVAGDDRDFAL